MKRSLFLLLAAFVLSLPAMHADVTVEATLDTAALRIGEQVGLNVRVKVPKGTKVVFPEYRQGYLTDGVEVLECGRIDTAVLDDGARLAYSRRYLLTSFDSALYSLPAVEVSVAGRKVRSTTPLGLKVSSVPVDTLHPDDIRDPYGPIDVPYRWSAAFLLQCLLLWLLVAAFVVSLCRLLKREPLQRRISVAPPPPAHKVALDAIAKFKGREAETEEELKRYYDELTAILRTYIKQRFDVDAREMTSAQLIQALTEAADQSALFDLRELLQTADLVKFARLQTSTLDNDRSLLHALEYVNQTKSTEVQPERIVKVVDVDLRRRRLRIAVRWVLTVVAGVAVVGYAAWLIYILVDTFR